MPKNRESLTFGLNREDYERLFVEPSLKQRDSRGVFFDADPYPKSTEDAVSEIHVRGYEIDRPHLCYLAGNHVPKRVARPGKDSLGRFVWSRNDIDAICDHLEKQGRHNVIATVRKFHRINPVQDMLALQEAHERTGIGNPEMLVMFRLPVDPETGYAEVKYLSPDEVFQQADEHVRDCGGNPRKKSSPKTSRRKAKVRR